MRRIARGQSTRGLKIWRVNPIADWMRPFTRLGGAVLREHVAQEAVAVGQEATRRALLSLIDRRRGPLQREALKLGASVYGRRPKSFGHSVERGGQERAAKPPEPIAG
jgi:hypothetical protein